jgi:hypothetical protein
MGDVFTIQLDSSAITGHKTDNHVEAGGFSGAIRPEQPHHLAFMNAERNITHHGTRLVFLAQVGGLQFFHWGCSRTHSSRGLLINGEDFSGNGDVAAGSLPVAGLG